MQYRQAVTTGARAHRSPRPPFANAVFFPLAALYGGLAVGWWAFGLGGYVALPSGLTHPVGHAHEMLFGFAMAVVVGYLLGPQPVRITLSLAVLWLLARVTFLFWPGSFVAVASACVFAIGIALRVVPRFAHAAKQWRNRSIAPIVVGLAVLTGGGSLAVGMSMTGTLLPTLAQRLLLETIILLALLLFFMGGRILAPAIAGYLLRRGTAVPARVQPRLEGTGIVIFALALLVQPFAFDSTDALAGALLIGLGVLTCVRLGRWRPWRCARRADLLALSLGYAWLAVGLVLMGSHLVLEYALSGALHAIGIGALGTLTLVVMARTRLLYRYRDANAAPSAHLAAALVSISAMARLGAGAGFLPMMPMLYVAAMSWMAACLIIAVIVVRTALPAMRSAGAG